MDVRKRHRTGLIIFIICTISIFVIYKMAVYQDTSIDKQITADAGSTPAVRNSIISDSANNIPVSSMQSIDSAVETGVKIDESAEEITEENSYSDALTEQKEYSRDANVNDELLSKLPAAIDEEQNPGDAVSGINESSEAIKLLRLFYELLSEEQYDKAYGLLDDKFRLSAFKIIGAAEINKNDIDVYSFSEFLKALGVFKTLKIDRILAEKNEETEKEKICRIYYYQSFNIEDSDKIISPLIVMLKKSNEWKITALEDGNPGFAPF